MILSNQNLKGVREQIRTDALQSFDFFSNHVLALNVAEDVCSYAQDVIRDTEDAFIRTKKPRALATALSAWLASQGVLVLSTIQLPEQEILRWLELDALAPGEDAMGVTLDVLPEGVQVTWL